MDAVVVWLINLLCMRGCYVKSIFHRHFITVYITPKVAVSDG